MNNICAYCNNTQNTLTETDLEFISLFVDESEINKYKIYDDFFVNENSDFLVKSIFDKSLIDNNLINKMWEVNAKAYNPNLVCSICGKHILRSLHNQDMHKLYIKLSILQKEYVYNSISLLTKLPQTRIGKILEGNEYYYLYLAQLVIRKFDNNIADVIEKSDDVIRWFEYNEKGGGEDVALLSLIIGFIGASIIPNALYDIGKYSFFSIVKGIRKIIVITKTNKEVNNKILAEDHEYFNKLVKNSLLCNLTKKQKKKMLKKIVKYEIKNRLKVIERAINQEEN